MAPDPGWAQGPRGNGIDSAQLIQPLCSVCASGDSGSMTTILSWLRRTFLGSDDPISMAPTQKKLTQRDHGRHHSMAC